MNLPNYTRKLKQLLLDEGIFETFRRVLHHILIRQPLHILPFNKVPTWILFYAYELRSRILPWISDSHPLRLVWIDPMDIQYTHTSGHPIPPSRFGLVADGDWDKNRVPTDTHFIYNSVKDRYKNGTKWEKTAFYEEHVRRISNGNYTRGPQTMEDLETVVSDFDDFLALIETEGYKSQRELLRENPAKTQRRNNDTFHPVLNEVCVNISRNGEFIKRGSGTHRLAVAQALSLEEIPVLVRTRHADWQALRKEVRNTADPTDLSPDTQTHLSNPDLADIVPDQWHDNV